MGAPSVDIIYKHADFGPIVCQGFAIKVQKAGAFRAKVGPGGVLFGLIEHGRPRFLAVF